MRNQLHRLIWIVRRPLKLRPRSVTEELWRLRWLRRVPAREAGTLPWRGATLHFSDGRPVWEQLNDIFVGRVYDFASAAAAPRILDCGAHVGVAVLRLRELYPSARITAFEADPAIAELLRRNLTAVGDASTEVIAAAAWTADTTVAFRKTGSDNGYIDAAASNVISARDLAAFCREPVDLLKLDIEGAEERVIEHLHACHVLQRVRRLVCEWHQWTPAAPRLHAALETLVDAGFVYRLAAAGCLGETSAPVFPALAWPGNQMMLYAWQPSACPT